MSSAFFRRPGDGSSSSSSSSDGEEPEEVGQSQGQEEIDEGEADIATTESLSSHGSLSLGEGIDPTVNALANIDQHRTNLLSALLEDFAHNKACDMMNQARPGHNFNRSSPEIQPLARRLYEQVSRSMVHTGLLPASVVSESQSDRQTRATYLAGIESIALGAGLQSNDVVSGHARPTLAALEDSLAVARVGNQELIPLPHALQQPMASLSLHQSTNIYASPYSDLILSAPTNRRSHYESSFEQVELLGKGGFGRVYRTFNLFDKKEYAVKKIPLSPRLSQRYTASGHKELENVLREVQALAQLEHHNVVRYHATWIEDPKEMPPAARQPAKSSLTVQGRRLIAENPTSSGLAVKKLAPRPRVPDPIDEIVFAADSVSHAVHEVDEGAELTWSMRQSDAEPTSARPSEIFTDGHGQQNLQQDSVIDGSVHVLHVQMSVYPMTLAQYLAPNPANSMSAPSTPNRRHCFHLAPALRIFLGILCGLQYIHAKGLVHRDIKPSNIFISGLESAGAGLMSEGYYDVGSCHACPHSTPYFVNPRIGDFGLVAELARDDGIDDGIAGGRNSRPVGTQYYRPPPWTDSKEKYKSSSSPVDEKLDVFALGVILVEMLWYCMTSTERLMVLRDLQRGIVPKGLVEMIDQGHEPGTGNFVHQCILGMIERDPQRRWACAEVKERVEMLLKRCTPSTAAYQSGEELRTGLGADLRQVRSLDDEEAEAVPRAA